MGRNPETNCTGLPTYWLPIFSNTETIILVKTVEDITIFHLVVASKYIGCTEHEECQFSGGRRTPFSVGRIENVRSSHNRIEAPWIIGNLCSIGAKMAAGNFFLLRELSYLIMSLRYTILLPASKNRSFAFVRPSFAEARKDIEVHISPSIFCALS